MVTRYEHRTTQYLQGNTQVELKPPKGVAAWLVHLTSNLGDPDNSILRSVAGYYAWRLSWFSSVFSNKCWQQYRNG